MKTYKVTCKIDRGDGVELKPLFVNAETEQQAEALAKTHQIMEGVIFYEATNIQEI